MREMVTGGFRLDLLLEITKIARATYYYQLKKLNKPNKDKAIKSDIQSIYDEHRGNYGYRRIYLELRNRGFVINHKRVQGLMKSMGLTARIRRKRKYASYKGEVGKKADNLIQRQFEGSKPYEKCYTDVTEFALPEGKLYLSPVLDGYNSEIIDFTLSRSPDLKQVQTCLRGLFLRLHTAKPFSTATKAGSTSTSPTINFCRTKAFVLLCHGRGTVLTTE
ncbi:IS3 family transposase [Streptococcus agalactiae]|uniref:IS3 family transposase n=1 Tax=Streptococcus agalactiae TaxID=1311 RepID=UPI00396B1962